MLFKKRGFNTIKEVKINGETTIYGNERILRARKLNKLFSKHGIKQKSLSYFRLFPNNNIMDYSFFTYLDKIFPQFVKPLFSNYNWVGEKI